MNRETMPRPRYMERILEYRDKPVIKLLVGIRGSGKSALLEILRARLIMDGVPGGQHPDGGSFPRKSPFRSRDP